MLAVQQDGSALCYASDNLKDDKEVVMAAVKNYGYALSDASDSLKADKEVCLAAIGNSGEDVLDDISDSLKKDKEIISAIDNFEDDFDFDDSCACVFQKSRPKAPGGFCSENPHFFKTFQNVSMFFLRAASKKIENV